MKKISLKAMAGMMLVLTSLSVYGQNTGVSPVTVIRPYHLAIARLKTTNLVFPYPIRSVDRGSVAILAQKAVGVDNILQIRAAKQGFEPTNLTIITADGHLYSFLLHYADNPARLNLVLGKATRADSVHVSGEGGPALFKAGIYNEAELEETASKVAGKKRSIYGVRDKSYRMKLSLTGLFMHAGVMYYQILLENRSDISYDIGGFRFLILDEHRYKRTASQEMELKPVYIENDASTVKGGSSRCLVFALPKHILPDKKYLLIRLQEKNGDRNLALMVHSHTLLKAQQILP